MDTTRRIRKRARHVFVVSSPLLHTVSYSAPLFSISGNKASSSSSPPVVLVEWRSECCVGRWAYRSTYYVPRRSGETTPPALNPPPAGRRTPDAGPATHQLAGHPPPVVPVHFSIVWSQ